MSYDVSSLGNLTPQQLQQLQLVAQAQNGQMSPNAGCCGEPAGAIQGMPQLASGQNGFSPTPLGAMPQGLNPALLAQYPQLAGLPFQEQSNVINDCVRKYGALSLRMVGASEVFGGIESYIDKTNGVNSVAMTWTGERMVAETAAKPTLWGRMKSVFTGAPATNMQKVTEALVLPAGISSVFALSNQLHYSTRFDLAKQAYQSTGMSGAFNAFMARPEAMGKGLVGQLRGTWNNFLYNNMGFKSWRTPNFAMTTSGAMVPIKGSIQSIAGRVLPVMFAYTMLSAFIDGYCTSSKQGGVLSGLMGGTSGLAGEFVKTFVSYKAADLAFAAGKFFIPKLLPTCLGFLGAGIPLTLLSLGFMAVAGAASHLGVGAALTGAKNTLLGFFGFGGTKPCQPCGH